MWSECPSEMRSVEVAQSGPSAIFWLVQVLIVGAAQAATPFAKEYRNAGLYNGNTLVDLDGSTTLDMGQEKPTSSSSGLSGGFKSESSVVLPGMLQNSGGF